jgi:hypothetical protein
MGWTNWDSDSGKCNDFPILKNVQTSYEAHTLSSLCLLGKSSYSLRLNPYLHLVPQLRMGADIPTIPPACLHVMYRDNFAFTYSKLKDSFILPISIP